MMEDLYLVPPVFSHFNKEKIHDSVDTLCVNLKFRFNFILIDNIDIGSISSLFSFICCLRNSQC